MSRIKYIKILLAVLTSIFLWGNAYSCTCVNTDDISLDLKYKYTDVVFKGKVVSIDTIVTNIYKIAPSFLSKEIEITFKVEETYNRRVKSDNRRVKSELVKVRSGMPNADDCKFIFTQGQSYIVFADHPYIKRSKKNKAILETSSCKPTNIFSEDLAEKIRGLR